MEDINIISSTHNSNVAFDTDVVLNDFANRVQKISGDVRIYYKNGGDDIQVISVISKDYENIEEKIYSKQFDILKKYSNNNIDFRIIPKHEVALRKLLPNGFSKYAVAA
jgi:hypothetical protein